MAGEYESSFINPVEVAAMGGMTPYRMLRAGQMGARGGGGGSFGGRSGMSANPFGQGIPSFSGPGAGFANFGATALGMRDQANANEAADQFDQMHQANMAAGMPWQQSILDIFQKNPDLFHKLPGDWFQKMGQMNQLRAQPDPDAIRKLANTFDTVQGPNGQSYVRFYDEKGHLSHVERPDDKYKIGSAADGAIYAVDPTNPKDFKILRPGNKPDEVKQIVQGDDGALYSVSKGGQASPIMVNGQPLKGGKMGVENAPSKPWTTAEEATITHIPSLLRHLNAMYDLADISGLPEGRIRQIFAEYGGVGDKAIAWTAAQTAAKADIAAMSGGGAIRSVKALGYLLDRIPDIDKAPTYVRHQLGDYIDDIRNESHSFVGLAATGGKKLDPVTADAFTKAGIPMEAKDPVYQLRSDPTHLSDDQLELLVHNRGALIGRDYGRLQAEVDRRAGKIPLAGGPTNATPGQQTPIPGQ